MAGKKALGSWDPLDKRTKAGKATNGNKTHSQADIRDTLKGLGSLFKKSKK